MFVICSHLYSQSGKVPPFQIVLQNGKVFRAQNLPLGKPIIVVYFSPECEECHQFTEGLLKLIDDFQNASIALITYMPVDKVKQFVSVYKLEKYANIFAGTEGNSLFVLNYYKISKFPFVALYDKNGNLIKKYNNTEINLADLINRLKAL
jgi:cytochrome oxidase Cu insertion factor (SCO1/SenC/PrrC family)